MIRKSTVNLLNFGIENEDYVILEDGRIDYPEGQDANSVGYSVNETWLFGNQYLSHVFVPPWMLMFGNNPDRSMIRQNCPRFLDLQRISQIILQRLRGLQMLIIHLPVD